MESPLTVTLAEIRVSYMEDMALRSFLDPPPHYYHFVDDGFGHFRNRSHAESFPAHLNSLSPDLEYTIGHPSADGSIPFLDVLIHHDNSTSVYRKPTNTNEYTHFSSSASMASKESTIRTLTRRAFKLCSPHHLQSEINHLESTFLSNGYPLQKLQKRVYLNPTLLEKVNDGSNADTITKWLKLCGVKPKSKAKANQKRLQLTNKIETILSENDQVPSALTKAFIQKLYGKDVTAELLRLEVPLVKSAKSASDRKLVLIDALCHNQNSIDCGDAHLYNVEKSPEDKVMNVNVNCHNPDIEGSTHHQNSKVNDESPSCNGSNEVGNSLKFKILEDSLLSLQEGFESQKATLDLLLMEDGKSSAKKKCTDTQDFTSKMQML